MKRIRLKHLLMARWCHWLNTVILGVMIWSGLMIYWAYPAYTLFGRPVIPPNLYAPLFLDEHLALGMAWHFAFMWLFAINGLVYVLWSLLSGEWRQLLPDLGCFRDVFKVILNDLHIVAERPRQDKYNAAQRFAYTLILLMGLGSVLTGLAIYKPTQLNWLTDDLGGYQAARFYHFWLTIGYIVFFLVHVLQVARAGWNNFRGMVAGYEEVELAG